MSLSDVSEQIHIRSVYLQALENDDWSAIGAPVYTRGFIRTYARFLGLDPESAVQRFSEGGSTAAPAGAEAPGAPREAAKPGERRSPSLLLWVAAALAVVLVAAVVYNLYSLQITEREKPTAAIPAAASPSPPPGPAADTSPAVGASPALVGASPEAGTSPEATATEMLTKTITLRLSQASWLRVILDGQNVMEGVFPQGTVRTFHGDKVLVRIGNAGGVAIDVNGKSVGKLGADGDVVERNFSLAGE